MKNTSWAFQRGKNLSKLINIDREIHEIYTNSYPFKEEKKTDFEILYMRIYIGRLFCWSLILIDPFET